MKKLILSSVFVLGAALAVSAQTTKSCDSEHGNKSCCQKGTNSTSVGTGTTSTTTTTTTKSCCSKGGDSHTSTDNSSKNTTQTSASTILTTTKSEEANTNGEPK